jgi:C4-dicarboxylate-specific signal transduction histidine kinase
VLVALAFALTFVLRYFFPYPVLFLFFAAVMASAWFGGTGAGLFAVLLSTLVTDYFFVPPFNSFVIDATNISYFGAFVICALVASWVSAAKRKTEEALREARDHLEQKVAQRTAELEKSNTDLRRTMHEHDESQQALRQTQTELAHLSRALTMGELTSSIAHEINQPLTAVVAHSHACLEWLSADPPDIGKARQTINSILRDGTRAGRVLSRIRALFSKQAHASDWIDMNEVILELTVFFRDEAMWQQVAIRADLAPNLPRIRGDRVQLQQVVLNLMMNAMDAMQGTAPGSRELVIRSKLGTPNEVTISVEDSGAGLSTEIADKIFDPFFTTKPQGLGMGLSISRSIIEAHHGRLSAATRPSGGTSFQFTLLLSQREDA